MENNRSQYRLSDVINIIGGGTPKRSNDEFWGGKISWLSVVDFNSGSRFVSDTVEKITELGLSKSSAKLLPEGSLVISARGTVGCLAQLTKPMAFNQSCYGLSAKTDILENEYLYYLVKHKVTELQKNTHGSIFDTITRITFEHILVDIPSHKNERQITSKTLGDLDKKIELNRLTNQTLEQMAQALFKSWFVDFDPIIDNGLAAGNLIPDELQERAELRQRVIAERATNPKLKPLSDDIQKLFPSEFEESGNGSIGISGWIPKGWANKPLYDLGEFINGAAYKKFEPNKNNEGLPIVKIAELKSGITANTGFSAVDMPKKYHLKDQDILFSWSGNPETSIDTFVWALGDALLNQHIFKVVPNGLSNYSFLFALLKYLKPEFTAIARDKQTTGLGHVTVKNLKELFVLIPSDELLTKFEEQLKPILNRMFLGLKNTQSLVLQRDFLLPKLISGQITINKDVK